eukprot:scaffold1416_cov90-Cylindrotheca_fusiformis.AAC.2
MASKTISKKRSLTLAASPRMLHPIPISIFVETIQDTKARGGNPQLLLFTACDGKQEATRNIASNAAIMCTLRLPTGMPIPRRNTENYVTTVDGFETGFGGKAHSEKRGMINDWWGFYSAMSVLLEDSQVMEILQGAFGSDFRLLPERGYVRSSPLSADLNKTSKQLLLHKDYPKWIRSNRDEGVEVVTARCGPGELACVMIDQAEFHGIPSGGDCTGWFLSAVTPEAFQRYLDQLEDHLKKLRRGALSSLHHDPEAHRDSFSALDALILAFCKGSRPHLYESGKVIQAPHPMAAKHFPVRQHRYLTPRAFAVVRNKKTKECEESVSAIMRRLEGRGLAYAFRQAATSGPWNVDPSTFTDHALLRFFGIAPDV